MGETKLERQTRLDFEAEEKSCRELRRKHNRVLAAGRAKQPTKVATDTAGGPCLIRVYDKLDCMQK